LHYKQHEQKQESEDGSMVDTGHEKFNVHTKRSI